MLIVLSSPEEADNRSLFLFLPALSPCSALTIDFELVSLRVPVEYSSSRRPQLAFLPRDSRRIVLVVVVVRLSSLLLLLRSRYGFNLFVASSSLTSCSLCVVQMGGVSSTITQAAARASPAELFAGNPFARCVSVIRSVAIKKR